MTSPEKIRIASAIKRLTLEFQKKKLERLEDISVKELFAKIDPFLLNLSDISIALKWATVNLDRFMSDSEETLKGQMYERIAFAIAALRFGTITTKDPFDIRIFKDKLYLLEVKSGANWGNSSQWKALEERFKNAIQELSSEYSDIQPLLGICYGKGSQRIKRGIILELKGPIFWEFLTDDSNFYWSLPLMFEEGSRYYIGRYRIARNNAIQRLVKEITPFCFRNGELNKKFILEYSSAKN
jgi:hypothetical protein